MKRLNEIEQTLTQYPETERRKLALEQLQREAEAVFVRGGSRVRSARDSVCHRKR